MKKIIALSTVMLAPFFAHAAPITGITSPNSVSNLMGFLRDMINNAVSLILAAAVAYFLWNVFKFVMSAGDAEKRAEGQQGIIYGIIGIAVMVSIFGLVTFFTSSAGLSTGVLNAPTLNI